MYENYYDVQTQWGPVRLDAASYRDYLAGKLWIAGVPVTPPQPAAQLTESTLPPAVTGAALALREAATRQSLYATLQGSFPGAQVEVPYKTRFRDKSIDELCLSVRSSNGLMRAGAGTFGRVWELLTKGNGLRSIRNLGAKSEAEIKRCFLEACYQALTPGEQAIYWQKMISSEQVSK